jgi:hypothetical protein
VWLVRRFVHGGFSETLVPTAAAIAMMFAATLLLWRPRFAYLLAAIAGVSSLYWFSRIELKFPSPEFLDNFQFSGQFLIVREAQGDFGMYNSHSHPDQHCGFIAD